MGGRNTESNKDTVTDGGTTGTSGNSTSPTSTSGGTGRTGGTGGTGGNAERKSSETIPQILPVDDTEKTDEQKRHERNAKRRERYAEEKARNGQTVKPRKVNKGKTKQTPSINMTGEQLTKLIVSTSSVVASRPNCQHWLLTEAEADSIVTPLMAIIAESEKLEMITKNSNQIALVFACITIFVPRLFVTIQMTNMNKEKKKNGIIGHRPVQPVETGTPESNDKTTGGRNDKGLADNSPDNDYVLSWDD